MPVIGFSPEHKTETSSDFPKLKLDSGEKARILCLEDPTFAYVHTLRAPKIVNGKAEKKVYDRKDGSQYTDFVKDFIGRPLCLGDHGILADKGTDPKNCPACKKASEGDQVDGPQRRFAMHVIKYSVKTNSFEPRVPFSCELVIWGFTNTTYNKLTDIVQEYGNLREHDLMLGPCTNKDFQKFEIMASTKAAWQADDTIKKTVLETYKHNRLADLDPFIGRKVERRWLEEDLEKIAVRWRVANGSPAADPGTEGADTRSLTEGLDGLFNDEPALAKEEKRDEPVDLGSMLDAGTEAAPVSAPPASSNKKPADSMNFDELLNSL